MNTLKIRAPYVLKDSGRAFRERSAQVRTEYKKDGIPTEIWGEGSMCLKKKADPNGEEYCVSGI